MIKKILKALTKTLVVVLLSTAFLLAILQNSHVQSYIAKSASAILSNRLAMKIWIDKVNVRGFFDIKMKGVSVLDHHQEPMITFKELSVDLPLLQGISNNIPINSLNIDSAFVRVKKYKGEDVLNINYSSDTIAVDTLELANSDETKEKSTTIFEVTLDHLLIKNTRFIYEDENIEFNEPFGMNYTGLDISNIDIEMQDIQIYNDSIVSNIIHLGAKDKSGAVLKHLEGWANVSSKGTFLTNAQLQTPRSTAKLDLGFKYDKWSAYLDFINEVYIDSEIKTAKLNMDDISFFAPEMRGMDNMIRFNGKVSGAIRNLKSKDLVFSYGEHTSFKGDVQFTGLPNFYESFMKYKINALSTHISDIQSFKLPNGALITQIPAEIERFGNIRIKGKYTGFYNDFVSNADIYTELGKLYTNIQFQNNEEEDILYYNGEFEARNFDLGKFVNLESDIGDINFDLDVEGKGLNLDELETNIVGRIDSMEFRKNPINTIYIDAFIQEKQFNGSVRLNDNLINADFTGLVNFYSESPVFDFKTHFSHVKLAQLGLLDVDSTASLSSNIHMNFTGKSVDEFVGEIRIDSTRLYYVDRDYKMDSLYLFSTKNDQVDINDEIIVRSEYISGNINGKYSLESLGSSLELLMNSYVQNVDFIENDSSDLLDESFELDFKVHDITDISKLLLPDLHLEDTVYLKGHYYQSDRDLQLSAQANYFEFSGLKFSELNLGIETNQNDAKAKLNLGSFVFKDATEEDTLQLGIDEVALDLKFANNKADYQLNWNNHNPIPQNDGDIKGQIEFNNNRSFKVIIDSLNTIINDSIWYSLNPTSVLIDSSSVYFDSLRMGSINQEILLDGTFAESLDHGFIAKFKNFNIAAFNLLLKSSGISLDGYLTGDFQLIDAYNSAGFLTDLNLNDFYLNGEHLGDAEVKSTWNADQSVFVNLNIAKQGNKGEYKPLYLEGYYYPSLTKDQLDIDISLHNLKLNFLNPFLDAFVSDLDGAATGEISVKGSLKEPDLTGQLDLARTQFRIIYLNTLYSLSGTLNLDNQMLGFNQVSLYDTVGNIASLTGGLTHQRLRNFGVDLKVSPKNFVALNTREGMNELFFGRAIVTGDVLIKGPFDNVFLDINARSNRGTDLKIPINTSLGVSENNFIVFVNNEDSLANEKVEQSFVPQLSNFSLNMDLSVTTDAKVEISLPAQLGEIQATGSGDLNMNLSRTGNFRMSGDYRVSDGLFYFRIRNLLNRRFDLNEGGTISWTGDPYNGILGMSANYQLKTSLNSLGLEQDSSYRNRVPVDCIIGLSGPIMDPNVKFKFDFPNATEEVEQYVYTKIDTTNPSEMSQQMLSLLIFNSFSFNSGTGDNTLASSVTGSSMQIVANQLSNWLSQISKDVDIGINYRPGGDLTNEEVEVALSTQLWDERVTIDGNFGYQNVQDNPSANASSIVGDLNVEVKITKDGRLRLKAFNRTNTVDLLDNTSPYTQGVGIFYRKEFNNLQELFTNQRKKEKEKREAELQKSKARATEDEDDKALESEE